MTGNAPGAGYFYMLVRHVPADPKLFDYYVKGCISKL